MLSAQIAGAAKLKMGMNHPGSDNKQLALKHCALVVRLTEER